MLLNGKTAVISGAASRAGIGLATARLFAAHGARVEILDLEQTAADSAAQSLGSQHMGITCDVTDEAACTRAAAHVIEVFGHADILINNAGITQPLRIMDIKPGNWDRVLYVNLRRVLYLSQAFIPHMRG